MSEEPELPPEMPEPPDAAGREDVLLGARLRVIRLIALIGGAFVWGNFLLQWLFGFNLYHSSNARPMSTTEVFWISVGITVVGGLFLLNKILKAKTLAARGSEIEGVVIDKSMLRRGGMAPITVQYTVDGVDIQVRKDLSSELNIGDKVRVVYDPHSPKRCEIRGYPVSLKSHNCDE